LYLYTILLFRNLDKEKMKAILQLFLIILVAMIGVAIILTLAWFGITLIRDGWVLIEEMREILLVK